MSTDKSVLEEFDRMILERKATWWEMTLPSGDVIFGSAKAEMLGRDEKDFENYKDFTALLHPDDYEEAMQKMRDHLEGRADKYQVEYRIKDAAEKYVTFYDYGKIVEKEGKNIKLIGLVFKIENERDMKNVKELLEEEGQNLPELLTRSRN